MYTLFALVLTATAVVIARPPGPVVTTAVSDDDSPLGLEAPTRKYLREYVLPRYLWPHFVAYEDNRVMQPQLPATDWLNKEIERLSHMQDRALPYNIQDDPRRIPNSFMKRLFGPTFMRNPVKPYFEDKQDLTPLSQMAEARTQYVNEKLDKLPVSVPTNSTKKTDFALTPQDDGFFEYIEQEYIPVNQYPEGMHEGGGQPNLIELEPPRQIRQNPNRNKNLIAANLDKLSIGLGQDGPFATEKPRNIRTESMEFDGRNSFYGVAVISAIGAAVVMALLGFGIGWYTLSKRAKAAADVDYPAYGVTGPTIDSSGDRKLAHSAHMYHYQHQKQQIIAMERNGMEQRNGSVSDPESEDENEEGDYTVYECPGFATTGEMEVKNPLFNEDPTPATPGKCEVVKPQPKD